MTLEEIQAFFGAFILTIVFGSIIYAFVGLTIDVIKYKLWRK